MSVSVGGRRCWAAQFVPVGDAAPTEPFLKRLSQAREADLGRDGSTGLTDLLLVRRFFGPEILPLWRWRPGSDLVTGRDRVAEIRLGQQYLTLAYRDDVDGEGDFCFDVLLPCPFDAECAGQAWAPVYSVTDLYKALTGAMDNDPTSSAPSTEAPTSTRRPTTTTRTTTPRAARTWKRSTRTRSREPRRRRPAPTPAHPGRTPGRG